MLVWYEKLLITVWIAMFLGCFTTMVVIGVSGNNIDLRQQIAEDIIEEEKE